jgi:arylsulfatase A-like enzyme
MLPRHKNHLRPNRRAASPRQPIGSQTIFLQKILLLTLFIFLPLLIGDTTRGAEESPPNVIVFLVDDLGQRDLGCYGSTFYETPHVDRIAREGMRFTDAYAACPVCSPTRASLMTGQWPQRLGITDYIGAPRRPEDWKRNTKMVPATYSDRLDLAAPNVAKQMKLSGYATFFAGKWHLGPEGWWPEKQGFDINMGGIDQGGPYGGNKYFSPYENPRLSNGPPGEHLPDRLASETIRFIEENKEKPFLAYFSFYSVHTPLMARKDLQAKYDSKRKRLGLVEKWGREQDRDVRLVQEHAVYAAMVEAMDLAVGRVLDALDRLGLSDNTLIIFTSDNGGLSTSEGWPTSNLPLRAGKGWMYEGGIRVPYIVRWPKVVAPGTVNPTPISSPDLYATLLDVTKQKPQTNQFVDGQSLVPLFQGKTLQERSLYWHYPHYGNQGGAPGAAIRRGNHKLIEWFEDDHIELYDVRNDIGEETDLTSQQPELAKQLRDDLHRWQKEVHAKFPTDNPNYDATKPNGRAARRPVPVDKLNP